MKTFLLGLSVGVTMCMCGFMVYVFVSQFDFLQNRSLDSLDQLYFAQPREGCLTEWIYRVDKLAPAERNLVCEKLEKCTETFLLAYLGVNVITNQAEFVRLMNRYMPIKRMLE